LDLNAKVDALSKKLDQLLASGFVPAIASHIYTHHMMHVYFALTHHIKLEPTLPQQHQQQRKRERESKIGCRD
jgi:hypothetical protein